MFCLIDCFSYTNGPIKEPIINIGIRAKQISYFKYKGLQNVKNKNNPIIYIPVPIIIGLYFFCFKNLGCVLD